MEKHKHGVASNTRECFRSFLGHKVVGLLFNANALGAGIELGTTTIIFECGYGLTVSSRGSYWVDSPEAIKRAVDSKQRDLRNTEAELREVLQLARQ